MKCFHGTTVQNIAVLQPFANPDSNLQYPCVYLSTSEALAAVYIWDRPYKWMTFEINSEGIPVYYETYPNQLQEFYEGKKGCIYTCEGAFEVDEKTTISLAVVSKSPVPVSCCETIEDAYQYLLDREKEGKIVLERYAELSEKRRESVHRMVLNTIKRMNLLQEKSVYSPLVKEKFPQIWEEAKALETDPSTPEK